MADHSQTTPSDDYGSGVPEPNSPPKSTDPRRTVSQNPDAGFPEVDDPGTADFSDRSPGAPPTVESIEKALRDNASHAPDLTFVPSPYGTPGDAPFGPYPGTVQADQGGFSFSPNDPRVREQPKTSGAADLLRSKLDEMLPVVALIVHMANMYADRTDGGRGRSDVDRILDTLGYEPVRYDVTRSRMQVPDDRGRVYRALSGGSLT